MTIDEMRARKKELGYSYQQLSELSGIPLGTVQKVMGKITKSPRYDTIRALEKVLRREPGEPCAEGNVSAQEGRTPPFVVKEARSYSGQRPEEIVAGKNSGEYASVLRDGGAVYGSVSWTDQPKEKVENDGCDTDQLCDTAQKYGRTQDIRAEGDDCNADRICEAASKYGQTQDIRVEGDDCNADRICEAAPKYGQTQDIRTETGVKWERQGEYTLEDYYALPDERRVELIDGVFYDMASSTTLHQILASRIFMAFANYVDSNGGTCVPMISPLDVQLDEDDKTMLQPDVLIVCDREKFKKGIVYGAPDLVVEILSESTRNKDQLIKLNKYFNAGVREYWIVDPKNRQIVVYTFENGVEFHGYGAESVVPVGIFNGECNIDFGGIFTYVSFLEDAE